MGGTFDPVHNGHLEAGSALRTHAGLHQVWLIPNSVPPHREKPLASPGDRMRMVELAVAERLGLVASRIEIERGGISYTIDTIRELHARFPSTRFELLLGTDVASRVREWHEAAAVLKEGWFVIFTRPGTAFPTTEMAALGFTPGRTRFVQVQTPNISAHDIRRRLSARESIEPLVPPSVASYIAQHHLYRG